MSCSRSMMFDSLLCSSVIGKAQTWDRATTHTIRTTWIHTTFMVIESVMVGTNQLHAWTRNVISPRSSVYRPYKKPYTLVGQSPKGSCQWFITVFSDTLIDNGSMNCYVRYWYWYYNVWPLIAIELQQNIAIVKLEPITYYHWDSTGSQPKQKG